MTEPTLEEMKPQSYTSRPSPAIKAVRWSGSNWDEVHTVYPTLGEEYMRDRGCREGDWVISTAPGHVDFLSHDSFSKLYMVSEPEPAPEIVSVRPSFVSEEYRKKLAEKGIEVEGFPAAPDSEDEAFENARDRYDCSAWTEKEHMRFREGWNARARLFAGGK